MKHKNRKNLIILAGIIISGIGFTFGRALATYVLE